MDRVFLDANVLFSAAYAVENLFLELWRRKGIRRMTSDYALEEVKRNLATEEQRQRLKKLVERMEIVPGGPANGPRDLPHGPGLPEKDRPILAAAVAAGATHLLTGDRRHFGKYFGKRIAGVLIQPPAQYLRAKRGRQQGE